MIFGQIFIGIKSQILNKSSGHLVTLGQGQKMSKERKKKLRREKNEGAIWKVSNVIISLIYLPRYNLRLELCAGQQQQQQRQRRFSL